LKKSGVFVKDRQPVACRAAHRLDTGRRNLRGLQLVEAPLGQGKLQPAQAVKKVMQSIAGGYLTGAMDESLIGLPGGQCGLGNKLNRRGRNGAVQRLRAVQRSIGQAGHGLASLTPGRHPANGPVNSL
jgi:hypothetical protein